MSFFKEVRAYSRFPAALRRFLRTPVTFEDAQRLVRERIERRADNFLDMVRQCIYGYPHSPYLPLLRMAGCEYGDVAALVKDKGIEGALSQLRGEGVYFSFEEFKGRVPVVRGGQTIPVKPDDFDNPFAHRIFSAETSGSTGTAMRVGQNLDQIAAHAPYRLLMYDAYGVRGAQQVIWRGILPDDTLTTMLMLARVRHLPYLWYSPIGLRDSKQWLKYDVATYYVLAWMRLMGVPVPFPRFASVAQADTVARAVGEILRTEGRCFMTTQVSSALRLCLAAEQAGIDLTGFTLFGGGEPPTPGKVAAIERTGARFAPHYATMETNLMAHGCVNRIDTTDVHVFKDAYTVITHPHIVEGFDMTVPAFNITGILPTSPKVLLNFQTDDYGIVEDRACGCAYEQYGLTTHLREVRSYRKLTGEGVTLIGTEMVSILEGVLPARFGGSSFDYQLHEEEDGQGLTRLYLVIHPRVAIADEQVVIDTVLNALRASSNAADAARSFWQKAGTLKIRRAEPIIGATGKMMPLHFLRRAPAAESSQTQ